MNQQNCALAAQFVSNTYIQQGAEALATRHRLIRTLLSQRRLPEHGWDDDSILLFIKASVVPGTLDILPCNAAFIVTLFGSCAAPTSV